MFKRARVFWMTFLVFWIALLFVPIGAQTRHDKQNGDSTTLIYVWRYYEMTWDEIARPPRRRWGGDPSGSALALVLIHDAFAAMPAILVALVSLPRKRASGP
jgi:hypothetical protein